MRYSKLLVTALAGGLFIAAMAASSLAGLNPGSPGLPSVTVSGYAGGTALGNNQMSIMCVACHTRIPYDATNPGGGGTHFVYQDANLTNSGGGWTNTQTSKTGAVRDAGEYYHIGAWSTAGIYSKYGDPTGRRSTTNAAAGSLGYELALGGQTAATLNGHDMICESCHNIVRNVAGGNNLLEPLGNAVTVAAGYQESANANLCVGCHGWLYDVNDAANAVNVMANNGHYDNVWNMIGEAGTAERGSNAAHWIGGTKYNMNHHVMTGDAIQNSLAAAGLLWRDVLTVPPESAGADVLNTAARGAMPQQATWADGKIKSTTAANLNCINCHASGHGGDVTVGASILRDSNLSGRATTAIQRISDAPRTWWDFTDGNFCMDCHRVR